MFHWPSFGELENQQVSGLMGGCGPWLWALMGTAEWKGNKRSCMTHNRLFSWRTAVHLLDGLTKKVWAVLSMVCGGKERNRLILPYAIAGANQEYMFLKRPKTKYNHFFKRKHIMNFFLFFLFCVQKKCKRQNEYFKNHHGYVPVLFKIWDQYKKKNYTSTIGLVIYLLKH